MRAFLEKQRTISITIIAVMLITLALYVAGICLLSSGTLSNSTENVLWPIFLIIMFVGFVLFWVWAIKFRGCIYSYNYLKKRGLEYVLDDINLAQPVLPKSKIYCGSRALFSKKPFTVLPYSEIAWVYVQVKKLYGLVPVSKTIFACTRDGKRFALEADVDEFKWLLENYLIKVNPAIIIGFGPQQKERYKACVSAYKASLK